MSGWWRRRDYGTRRWGPSVPLVVLSSWVVVGLTLVLPNAQAGTSGAETLVAGNTAFAFDLYARLKTAEGNVFFSPYSISTCLAMVYGGARQATEKQISQVLHFDKGADQIGASFGELQKQLKDAQQKGGVQLDIANGLWAEKEHAFLPAFLENAKRFYEANVTQVDFRTHADAATSAINSWVSERTQKKIPRLFEPGMLNAQTRMALVNAIYFKGKWANTFSKDRTADAPFRMAGGSSVTVPMMSQTSRFRYSAQDDLQLLEMPYGGGLSMVILLPAEIEGLDKLDVSPAKLSSWLAAAHLQKVNVFMPRFRLETQYQLNQTLDGMGMRDAFTAAADFSGMDGKRDLYLSIVVHKAFVEVNEEGTEAAAATGAGISLTSAQLTTPTFRADHPFLFLIRETTSGSILFLGKLAAPAK
jgi:serine protease inhibitor